MHAQWKRRAAEPPVGTLEFPVSAHCMIVQIKPLKDTIPLTPTRRTKKSPSRQKIYVPLLLNVIASHLHGKFLLGSNQCAGQRMDIQMISHGRTDPIEIVTRRHGYLPTTIHSIRSHLEPVIDPSNGCHAFSVLAAHCQLTTE